MDTRILITGATGQVGTETIRALIDGTGTDTRIIAAVRNPLRDAAKLPEWDQLSLRKFDFTDTATFPDALRDIDVLFLLRPPQIADVDTYFGPLLKETQHQGITKIVLLSVQGAEKSSIIPHRKIEQLILEYGFDHIFLRPSYLMQNLTGALLREIRKKQRITLPAGSAKFNWIDVADIGRAAAVCLSDFDQYQNQIFTLTGSQNLNFEQVSSLMSEVLDTTITYRRVNPVRFYLIRRRTGIDHGFALVQTILHFLPRFQSAPEISEDYRKLTGEKPTSLGEFLGRERNKFISEK